MIDPIPACVLFDLDGTLVDSAPDLGHAANHVREAAGLPPLPLADYRPFASHGARGLLRIALDITPEHTEYETHKDRFLTYYRANLTTASRLFDGVPELLDALDRAGIRWGVVTNKVDWLSKPMLENLGLAARSRCLVSGDSTPHPKPAPDGLLLAAREADVAAADCVYVGDDLRDIVAGRAAGMRTVAAGWGYLGAGPGIGEWGADFVVGTPVELMRLLALKKLAFEVN